MANLYFINYEIWRYGRNTGREVGVYVNTKNQSERVSRLKSEYPKNQGYELKQKISRKVSV